MCAPFSVVKSTSWRPKYKQSYWWWLEKSVRVGMLVVVDSSEHAWILHVPPPSSTFLNRYRKCKYLAIWFEAALPCLACREFSTFLHVPERRSSINTGNAKERGEMFGGCSALPCPFSGQDKSSWLRGLTLVCTEFRLPPLHRVKQWTGPEEKIMKMYFVNFMIPSCGLFLKLIIFAQVFSMKLLPSEELDRWKIIEMKFKVDLSGKCKMLNVTLFVDSIFSSKTFSS